MRDVVYMEDKEFAIYMDKETEMCVFICVHVYIVSTLISVGLLFNTVVSPVAEPSSVCVPVAVPVGLLSAAYVSGSSVCSTLCTAGSTLHAAYLIPHTDTHKHKTTHRKQNQFGPQLQVPFCCCHGEVYPWQWQLHC